MRTGLFVDGRIYSVALSDRLFLETPAVMAQVEADVAAVIADLRPVITNASAIMIESTLSLSSGSSEDQTGCEHYSKFRFHNIHFY